MKLAAAVDFYVDVIGAIPPDKLAEGRVCAVNYVHLHATQLFPYAKMEAEVEELDADAKLNGVPFSTKCGDAVLPTESVDDYCYICRGMRAATAKPTMTDEERAKKAQALMVGGHGRVIDERGKVLRSCRCQDSGRNVWMLYDDGTSERKETT
jgi:ubiquitin